MEKIVNDAFYEYIKQYDSDSEYRFVDAVDYGHLRKSQI